MVHQLSPEDSFDLRTPTGIAVSPNGDRIAFIVTEADPEADQTRRSLFVVPADGSHDPHRLSRVADAGMPKWSPDGTRLAFIASRKRDVELAVGRDETTDSDEEDGDDEDTASESGKEEPKSQVWVFNMAWGGDARQVTAFEEGVNEFDWGPNGDRIVVSAREPTDDQQDYLDGIREKGSPYEVTRLQHKVDGSGYTDDVTTYLFTVDIDTRESTRLDDAYGRGASVAFRGLSPAWAPGDRIAFGTYRGPKPDETYVQDAHTISPDGTDLRKITDGDLTTGGFRWSPDGTRLAFYGSDPENTYKPTEVYVADGVCTASDRDTTYRSVSASLDRTVGWAGTAEWISDDALLAPIGDEAQTKLVRLHANRDAPERVFTGLGTGRTITSFDAVAGCVGACLSHPNQGRDVFTADVETILGGGEPTRLSQLNADLLADAALPTCERVHFENNDNMEVEGLVYRPADFDSDDPAPRPLICYIHGGPTAYDAPGFDFDYAHWTGKGYIVLTVNYRGSTSYGRAFSEEIHGNWGPREADDIISGVEHLIERGWADPDRLFCSGFSQGAINTLYVITRTDMFTAAAPEHGIYDFYSNFGTGDMHQWYVNENGVLWENEEQYREMSSLIDVGEITTPLLIMAGENDWRCPPSQAEQLYVSAKRAGVDAKLVVYQDEHHNIGDPKRGVHRLKELTEWFETHDPTRID